MKDQYVVKHNDEIAGILYVMDFELSSVISHIWTNPGRGTKDHRGHGHARELLSLVCADADQEKTTLLLKVEPDPGYDLDRLLRLYEEFGFKSTSLGKYYMERLPKVQ